MYCVYMYISTYYESTYCIHKYIPICTYDVTSEYTIYTSVDGQKHTLDKDDVVKLVNLYNSKNNSTTIGRATFTRTWKFSDIT